MLIDWFTVIAQVINFLVLVWLMKRFLYKPILSAIEARETGIAAKLADANAKIADAQTTRDEFQHKTEAFEQQRIALLNKATADADAEHQRLLDSARKDADAVHSQWQDALRNEQYALAEEIVRRTRQGVFDIARKTLAELATVGLEECMANVFIARLRGLNGTESDQFAASLKTAEKSALVRSAFALPPAQRAAIQTALNEAFSANIPLRFETAPDLVSGIELTTNGQKVAWSISDYLTTFEKSVGTLVEEKTGPQAKPVDKPTPNVELKPHARPASEANPAPQLVSR